MSLRLPLKADDFDGFSDCSTYSEIIYKIDETGNRSKKRAKFYYGSRYKRGCLLAQIIYPMFQNLILIVFLLKLLTYLSNGTDYKSVASDWNAVEDPMNMPFNDL